MPKLRVIKRRDGVIQTQHRMDERYDESTLPEGTTIDDVEGEAVVEGDALLDVEDVQAQMDIVDGRLMKDLSKKPLFKVLGENRAEVEKILQEMDEDDGLPQQVKKYLTALRDYLNIGPGRPAHPVPSSMSSNAGERKER